MQQIKLRIMKKNGYLNARYTIKIRLSKPDFRQPVAEYACWTTEFRLVKKSIFKILETDSQRALKMPLESFRKGFCGSQQ